jgi:recombinational DNA repair ATPase RecF
MTVLEPVEFRTWKKQLERIDEILIQSGAEAMFQRLSLAKRFEEERRTAEKEERALTTMSVEAQANYQRRCSHGKFVLNRRIPGRLNF